MLPPEIARVNMGESLHICTDKMIPLYAMELGDSGFILAIIFRKLLSFILIYYKKDR